MLALQINQSELKEIQVDLLVYKEQYAAHKDKAYPCFYLRTN